MIDVPPGTLLTLTAAYEHGMCATTIQRRVRQGLWQMVLPDVLLTRAGPLTSQEQRTAALMWAGPSGALAASTAASIDGLRGHADDRVHLAVPATSGLRSRQFVVVRRNLEALDVHPSSTPRRTRLPRSVVELARTAVCLDDAIAVLAAAVQQRLVRPATLRETWQRLPKARYRREALALVDDLEGGSHSLPEVQALRAIKAAGLPLPSRQEVRYENGRRRYLDLYWDDLGLCIEIDGAFHMAAATWWADMERDADLSLDGLRVQHVPAFVVRHHPEAFVRLVRRYVDAALATASADARR